MTKLQRTKYPPGVNGDDVYCIYPDFEDDLKKCLYKSGNKERFCGMLNQRIKWVLEKGTACIIKRDWAEPLKHCPKHILYSLRFKDKENVRIIFIFNNSTPVFLSAFKEKNSYSYPDGMDIAHKRISKLIDAGLLEEGNIVCHSN